MIMGRTTLEGNATLHPILGPCREVTQGARSVAINDREIERVANWMSAEELPWPDFRGPLIPSGNDPDTMDFIFLTAAINFAFTDFSTGKVFCTGRQAPLRSDSDAMMGCLKEALERGVPALDGAWLRRVGLEELDSIFQGSIRMPLLEERGRIFNEIGAILDDRWSGRFHNFLSVHGRGDGDSDPGAILGPLVEEFPSFSDFSSQRGLRIPFLKRAQLLLWQLHARFREGGYFRLVQPWRLTVFADYIVPMALRTLGILTYSAELEEAVESGRVIPADSEWEIEIRAATIWACHLLTHAINQRRPPGLQIIDPVLDARLWTHYHASHKRHHLTVTTDY